MTTLSPFSQVKQSALLRPANAKPSAEATASQKGPLEISGPQDAVVTDRDVLLLPGADVKAIKTPGKVTLEAGSRAINIDAGEDVTLMPTDRSNPSAAKSAAAAGLIKTAASVFLWPGTSASGITAGLAVHLFAAAKCRGGYGEGDGTIQAGGSVLLDDSAETWNVHAGGSVLLAEGVRTGNIEAGADVQLGEQVRARSVVAQGSIDVQPGARAFGVAAGTSLTVSSRPLKPGERLPSDAKIIDPNVVSPFIQSYNANGDINIYGADLNPDFLYHSKNGKVIHHPQS